MVENNKKKKRLNKSGRGSTEFIGFSAFATSTTDAASAATSTLTKNDINKNDAKNASTATATLFIPSPIYVTTLSNDGNYSTILNKIQTIFKKILKKDTITKCRAMQQLRDVIQQNNKQQLPKKEIVAITSYLFYIFETKLFIDNCRHVRYEILKTLNSFQLLVPKAFLGFLSNDHSNNDYKLIGMIYCMTCDSASEVKNEALFLMEQYNKESMSTVKLVLQDNIIQFIAFVLKNIHRPSNMPLLTSVTSIITTISTQHQQQATTKQEITSVEREEMEERYERIVLGALHALSQLLTNNHTDNDPNNNIIFDVSILKKQLTNSRPYFRKATYQIFTRVIQHCNNDSSTTNANPLLVDMLYYALDNEKDKNNQVILLQWLILLLKNDNNANEASNTQNNLNERKIHAHLCKLFQKGCHGSNAAEWSYMILPIIALLYPNTNTANDQIIISSKNEDDSIHNLQSILSILDSLEKGKLNNSNTNDNDNKACIASCIVEVVYYILRQNIMKHTVSTTFNTELNNVLMKYKVHFINSFQFFLNNNFKKNNKDLCITLTREINKLCVLSSDACLSSTKSVLFHYIHLSFWNDITTSLVGSSNSRISSSQLCMLLKYLRKETIQHQLVPCLTTLLQNIIITNNNDIASSVMPKYETIQLLNSILNATMPMKILPDIKRFLMNDLLSWMMVLLLNTSHNNNEIINLEQQIQTYFQIVRYILLFLYKSNENDNEIIVKNCFESFLKEILKASSSSIITTTPVLLILTNAITNIILCSKEDDTLQNMLLPCITINEYASLIFNECVISSNHGNISLEIQPHLDLFIRTCLGLSSSSSSFNPNNHLSSSSSLLLIPNELISSWIAQLTINNSDDCSLYLKPLLEYGIVTSTTPNNIKSKEMLQLGVQAWIWGNKETWLFLSTLYTSSSSLTISSLSNSSITTSFLYKSITMLRNELYNNTTVTTNEKKEEKCDYATILNQSHWIFCAQRILLLLQNYILHYQTTNNTIVLKGEYDDDVMEITYPINIITLFSFNNESLWLQQEQQHKSISNNNDMYVFYCFMNLLQEYLNNNDNDNYIFVKYILDPTNVRLLLNIIISISPSSSSFYWKEYEKIIFQKHVDRLFDLLSSSKDDDDDDDDDDECQLLGFLIQDATIFAADIIQRTIVKNTTNTSTTTPRLLYNALHALDYLLQKIGWNQLVTNQKIKEKNSVYSIFKEHIIQEKSKKQQSLIFNNNTYYKPINQHSVQKGDVLYYHRNVTTTANTVLSSTTSSMDSFLKSKVLKIHDDDYPNVYFTIQLIDDNGKNDDTFATTTTTATAQQQKIENNNERQTIPSKLYRKVTSDDNDTATLTNPLSNRSLFKSEDRQRMELFTNTIYQLLIEPVWLLLKPTPASNNDTYALLNAKTNNHQTLDVIAICLDTLISKCLIFESVHELQQQKQKNQDNHNKTTSIFENVQSIIQMYEQELQKSLLYSSKEKNAPLLLKWFTITNGFNNYNNTKTTNNNAMIIPNMTIMHCNPMSIFKTLHQYYSRPFLVKQSTCEFNCFVLSWISTALETLQMETTTINQIDSNENSSKVGNQLLDIIHKINTNLSSNSSSTSSSKQEHRQIGTTIIDNNKNDESIDRSIVHASDCYYFTSKRETSYLILSVYAKILNIFDCCNNTILPTSEQQNKTKEEENKEVDDSNIDSSSPISSLGAVAKELIPCFINLWDDCAEDIDNTNDTLTESEVKELSCVWFQSFASLLHAASTQKAPSNNTELQTTSLAQNFADGSIPYAKELFSYLYSSNAQRRWCAYQLLKMISFTSRRHRKISGGEETNTNAISWDAEEQLKETITNRNIIHSSMIKEEIEELEKDIKVASSWLPPPLMLQILKWTNDDEEDTSNNPAEDSTMINGRFLTWLTCLDFLEDAASVGLEYRGSISSYIQATSAVDLILTMAIGSITFKSGVNNNDSQLSSNVWFNCNTIKKTFQEGDSSSNYNISISVVAKYVLLRTAQTLPTLFKTWWKDTCPRSSQMNVNQHVQDYIAPDILKMELSRISKAITSTGLSGMTVNGSCVSREVTAMYEKDECQLSVTIRIPPLFPLRNVEVDCQKTLGVPEKRWKHWQLQIMLMLNNQDGSILDALHLWKENVDKEFEGVEPCPVCYSVICVKTHAMPNLQCKTCSNRFHTTCLYKWFQSSGKNQCVLCQQPWNGFRV